VLPLGLLVAGTISMDAYLQIKKKGSGTCVLLPARTAAQVSQYVLAYNKDTPIVKLLRPWRHF